MSVEADPQRLAKPDQPFVTPNISRRAAKKAWGITRTETSDHPPALDRLRASAIARLGSHRSQCLAYLTIRLFLTSFTPGTVVASWPAADF